MGVFRTSAALVLRPQFDYSTWRPYDAPPKTPGRGASIAANDNSDGGTAWDIGSYVLNGSLPGDTTGGPFSLTIADNAQSQYLILTGFNILIEQTRSIAGIQFSLSSDFADVLPDLTFRLVRNGVIQTPIGSVVGHNSVGYEFRLVGSATTTFDAPYTPAETNSATWGLAIRKEGSENCDFAILSIYAEVFMDGNVLTQLAYSAGTYTFGPTAIPVDATTILFFIDAVLHTNPDISAQLIVEISYNGGADWSGLFDSGEQIGGTFSRESGITEPRWWSRMGLLDPTNPDRQFKGSLIIAGGNLTTSVGVFTTVE